MFYPLSRHVDFFSSSPAPCLFRLQRSNLSMDLLRHFKTQWILYETRKLSQTLIRKVLLKQAHSQDQVPRFDITGNLEPSCRGPSLFNKAV
ncbi:hypothetical protein TNCT_403541 [Trichonephila clavata]|uniref:Uncharacterized protein n=1 Tax=Trichonephila clavata TaxID=2740835 RepID=A0A8X6LRV4_TRICU|nr:hypothetical protein TNCT_403541 [Trichonephila clavata]